MDIKEKLKNYNAEYVEVLNRHRREMYDPVRKFVKNNPDFKIYKVKIPNKYDPDYHTRYFLTKEAAEKCLIENGCIRLQDIEVIELSKIKDGHHVHSILSQFS